jgi:hypothetical protein
MRLWAIRRWFELRLRAIRGGPVRCVFQNPRACLVVLATRLRLGGLRAYFGGFGGYGRKNYGFSGNSPFMHVASVCFDASQPALFDQNCGRAAYAFLVSNDARSELLDCSRGDAGFAPVIYQPIQ